MEKKVMFPQILHELPNAIDFNDSIEDFSDLHHYNRAYVKDKIVMNALLL